MSSAYEFIKELIEKEKTPTPAYVFDLDRMKEFVEKVHSCLGEKAELCYAMKANPFLTGPMMDVVPSFEVCYLENSGPVSVWEFLWSVSYFPVYIRIRKI